MFQLVVRRSRSLTINYLVVSIYCITTIIIASKIFFFRKGDKSARKLLIMADQTKIDQFINLTGVDADRARFYIESAGGNVEVFSYPLILNMNVLYVCIDFTI